MTSLVNITIAIGKLAQKWILKLTSLNSRGGAPTIPNIAPIKPDDPANNPKRNNKNRPAACLIPIIFWISWNNYPCNNIDNNSGAH